MTAIANTSGTAQAYFDAWNRHDPAAIVATFGEHGTYSDPVAGAGLRGQAIAAYADGLFTAFPDLGFRIGSVDRTGERSLVAEWTMHGTNTGPLSGAPATGATVALPGIDVIELRGDALASVRGYFDRQTFLEQLGLQVTVMPWRAGPVTFGVATRLETATPSPPGAMSLTMLEVRTDEEVERVRETTRRILPELARMRGFLGLTTAVIGRRLYTMAAWAAAEDPGQLHEGEHVAAMREVYGGRIGQAGVTGIWTPVQLNVRVRCKACDEWQRTLGSGTACRCGAVLPDAPPVW